MFISSYDSVDFTSSTLGVLRLGRRLECYDLLNINLFLLYFSRVIIKKEKNKWTCSIKTDNLKKIRFSKFYGVD